MGRYSVSRANSRKFIQAGGQNVTLHTAPSADHSWEYNVDRDGFDGAIATWLGAISEAA